MKPIHILFALIVAFVWGSNFTVTKVALEEIPIFLLLMLRFIFTSLPFIFFIKRPKEISWTHLIALSMCLFVLKFSFVFGSISLGFSPGIASLTLQTQALFTIILSALIFKTKIQTKQIVGTLVSLSGIAMIAFQQHASGSLLGFILILCGAIMWSVSNILYRKAKDTDAFALTIWMSLFPPIPFFFGSLGFEGWDIMKDVITHLNVKMFWCLAFIVVFSTWIGGTCWAYLFKKYDASVVAPYSLLIPVFGIMTSWMFLGEKYTVVTIIACLIIFSGLVINQWPARKSV